MVRLCSFLFNKEVLPVSQLPN